eukprot:6933599-Alexandrium_andersonii.AAC.1
MRGSVALVPGNIALDRDSDEDLPDISAGVAAVSLQEGEGAAPAPTVAMDVDDGAAEPDELPDNYRP